MSKMYRFSVVDPKGGPLARRKIHDEVLGCKCYPLDVQVGWSALIKYLPKTYETEADSYYWHRLSTSPVENVIIPNDESWMQIETENTIYILEELKS